MARLDSRIHPELSESVISKLRSNSIFTVYDFMVQKGEDLMKQTGLTLKEIEEIQNSFHSKFGVQEVNVHDLHERELECKISTGIENLDVLLGGGGLRCGAIYEICGSSSAGKSQLCHWLSMHATSHHLAEVHYIDGSRNFYATRIQMMLDSINSDDNKVASVMAGIKVHQIIDIYELFAVMYRLSKVSHEDRKQSTKRLIIVDSLSVIFALVSTTDFNEFLCDFASVCRCIVGRSNTAIVIVNTVRNEHSAISLEAQETDNNFKLQVKPSLGEYWLYVPNVRLLMTQEEYGQRKIAVWKNNQLQLGNSCFVCIKDEGIFQC